MSAFGNVGSPLPGPPQADMMASAEMQAWLRRLQAEDRTISTRNKYLAAALAAGLVLLVVVLWGVYSATIGTYAVIDDIQIEQHPADQGRLLIGFRVLSPGKVYCRRTSGHTATDLIDCFRAPCDVDRPWSWGYQPGEPIALTLWYRQGLLLRSQRLSFPTFSRADVVILIDTTESMDPSINALKEKCLAFSQKLEQQALQHRFALIGFGDTSEEKWLERHEFTADAKQFRKWVARIARFPGGDPPESALDALEEALTLPFDEDAVRYIYLVTDADYHRPARSGATPEDIAGRMQDQRVLLRVFSHPDFQEQYGRLLGDTGKFDEIVNFGKVLSEGRLLED